MVKRKLHRKRTSAGAPPGTLVADPSSAPTAVDYLSYDETGCIEKATGDSASCKKVVGSRSVTWINVNGLADIALIEAIGKQFGLHRLALEDVVNVHQRPKVEEYDDHVFIVTRMVCPEPSGDETEQVSDVRRQGLCSDLSGTARAMFRAGPPAAAPDGGQIRKLGADYLAYALLDAVIDGYFPAARALWREDRAAGRTWWSSRPERLLGIIHEMKRDLLMLRRAVWPQREMLNALIRDECPSSRERTGLPEGLLRPHDPAHRHRRDLSRDLRPAWSTSIFPA